MSHALSRRHFTALAAGALALPEARAGVVWRLATGYRAESFHSVNLQTLAKEVEAATAGDLRITIHPNNTLLKLAEIRAAVQAGTVEAGETIMSSLVGEMPIAGADSVPFITTSYADARRMWRLQRPSIERQFAKRGLSVLYAVPWPPQGLYATRPVADTTDLAGRRMRTYNPTTQRIAEWVGAEGVEVPMIEVGRALAEGRIDCMITSAVTGVENEVWSHVRYYYPINAWFPKNIVFVNTPALQKLSRDAREALLNAAASAETRGWAASEAAAQSSIETLRRNGMRIEPAPRQLVTSLKRLGERFSVDWIRQVGAGANEIFVPYFAQS